MFCYTFSNLLLQQCLIKCAISKKYKYNNTITLNIDGRSNHHTPSPSGKCFIASKQQTFGTQYVAASPSHKAFLVLFSVSVRLIVAHLNGLHNNQHCGMRVTSFGPNLYPNSPN